MDHWSTLLSYILRRWRTFIGKSVNANWSFDKRRRWLWVVDRSLKIIKSIVAVSAVVCFAAAVKCKLELLKKNPSEKARNGPLGRGMISSEANEHHYYELMLFCCPGGSNGLCLVSNKVGCSCDCTIATSTKPNDMGGVMGTGAEGCGLAQLGDTLFPAFPSQHIGNYTSYSADHILCPSYSGCASACKP